MRLRYQQEGFSIPELSVVLAVMVVLAAWLVPDLAAWAARDRLDRQARALLQSLSYARSESVRRSRPIIVCASGLEGGCVASHAKCAGAALNWTCGWRVSLGLAASDATLRVYPRVASVEFTKQPVTLQFVPPTGQLRQGMTSIGLVTRTSLSGKQEARCIRIAQGGRARLSAGAC
jgi:type IV fimbrial biogenesis protein FimT